MKKQRTKFETAGIFLAALVLIFSGFFRLTANVNNIHSFILTAIPVGVFAYFYFKGKL